MRLNRFPCALLLAACLAAAGCAASSDHTTVSQRQDLLLKDPMNYSPTMDNTDITGGDIGHYDSQAMKRDLDDFWNP
jgi:type IV pilus biogenesis protein CpaD/CtpE